MGAKSEQLLVLKEEEKLLLTFRSRINDQLNRLKVEELSILSLMRKAQEEDYAGDEINLDEIGNGEDESDDDANSGNSNNKDDSNNGGPRDISHLTSMTGGFRGPSQGADGDVGIAKAVFRADPADERMTTMEVDLGDFESGSGAGLGGAGLGGTGFESAGFGGTDFGGANAFRAENLSGNPINPNVPSSAGAGMELVPLDLALGKTAKTEEVEEDDDDD